MRVNLRLVVILTLIAVPLLSAHSSDDKATIFVYRPSRFTGAARNPSIYVDGAEIARLHEGTYISFQIAPGDHSLSSAAYVEGNPRMQMEAGKQYFFCLRTGSWIKGAIGIAEMKLLPIAGDQAKPEMETLKQGKIKNQTSSPTKDQKQ